MHTRVFLSLSVSPRRACARKKSIEREPPKFFPTRPRERERERENLTLTPTDVRPINLGEALNFFVERGALACSRERCVQPISARERHDTVNDFQSVICVCVCVLRRCPLKEEEEEGKRDREKERRRTVGIVWSLTAVRLCILCV